MLLTNLDSTLFPEDCEVVHVPSHDLKVYLVHKNASTSLRLDAQEKGWQFYKQEDLHKLDCVDVFIREPRSRFISGINTFISHLIRDNPDLDRKTCEWMASKYLFINRHYLPQWHWILNLSRFVRSNCRFRLHPVEDLQSILVNRSRAYVIPMQSFDQQRVMDLCGNIDLWLLLDDILRGRCGQELVWSQLLELYKQHPMQPLRTITNTFDSIADALR